jgi:hypothetical protein
MATFKWLTAIPFALNLLCVLFANKVTPFIFGLPFFLALIIGCVIATSLVMLLIYRLDPANKPSPPSAPVNSHVE